MRSKIFMYLFFFAILLVIFQYMNEKKIFETQESKITSLTNKLDRANDSISALNDKVLDLDYFTLQGNDNAMSYLEGIGFEAIEVELSITDAIYEKNMEEGGNPLIPYEGTESPMRVNKVRFLNHRWILADFTDGTYWGEVVLEYFFDQNNELSITPIGSTMYVN